MSAEDKKRRRIKKMEVMVAERIVETPDTTTLVLFTGNDKLDYRPGHFITIDPHSFPALERFTAFLEDQKGKKESPRAYSLASSPHEQYLAVTIKEERYKSGATPYPPLLSPLLVRRTMPGERMLVTGFTGPYTLPEDIESRTKKLIHVCAGSGIVPNWSMIKFALHTKLDLEHVLICGNKTLSDVIYREQLAQLQKEFPDRLRVVHSLTREENDQNAGYEIRRGRVGLELLQEIITEPEAVEAFVCGPGITKHDKKLAKKNGTEPTPRFLETVLSALREVGLEKRQIHAESYG